MTVRIGIDTGGTFTDVVLLDEATGTVHTAKTPSTPPDFDEGVLAALETALAATDTSGSAVSFFGHGTTVGTNAVLEGEIPRLGLITNAGLRDVLEIGDQTRPALYDLQVEKPPVLIPRRRRLGIPGRIDSEGHEIEPLDESRTRAAIDRLVEADVDAIVVAMLFSYLNDTHERRVGELIEAGAPGMDYALSAAVHPEIREYDRTIATVLNQAIKTTVQAYFARLDAGIAELDVSAPLSIMHSGGGVFGTEQATRSALRTVLSGPAAGAVATRDVATREGIDSAIGMDMGGTSADVTILRDGELVRTTEGEINDLPIAIPMIDVSTVGAGGGSIARLDAGGALRVGPESAGADPGPICYGRGGSAPTVTDANLLLGRLDAGTFLDGEMDLAVDRTRDRFAETLADPMDRSVETAARSVIEVATAQLARQLRRVTVERGTDPADFALVGFGGAGPLHAAAVADRMGMETVIVPPNPGVFSARGLLVADVRVDESRSHRDTDLDPASLEAAFGALEESVATRLRAQGFEVDDAVVTRRADVRYRGQSYELTVDVPGSRVDAGAIEVVEERFHEAHERRYGHAIAGEPIELVTLRVSGRVPTPTVTAEPSHEATESVRETRPVVHDETGSRPTPVYNRAGLEPGATVTGPAILEETGATTVLPPATEATVTAHGSLKILL